MRRAAGENMKSFFIWQLNVALNVGSIQDLFPILKNITGKPKASKIVVAGSLNVWAGFVQDSVPGFLRVVLSPRAHVHTDDLVRM